MRLIKYLSYSNIDEDVNKFRAMVIALTKPNDETNKILDHIHEKYDLEKQMQQVEDFDYVVNNCVDIYGGQNTVFPKYKPEPINIHINSNGGCVTSCLALCSVISACSTPITTIAYGIVASAGFIIFVSGHYRLAYKNTTFLYHSIRGWNFGTLAERLNRDTYIRQLQSKIDEIVLSGSILSQSDLDLWTVEKNMDWVFFGDEALEHMIADELLDYDPEQEEYTIRCENCSIENCEDCECDA